MPPRSVCLNVFTTALGNGSEVDVSMKDVEGEKMDVDTKEEVFEERARHDSVQGSPNDSLTTTPQYTEAIAPAIAHPVATAEIDVNTLPVEMISSNSGLDSVPKAADTTAFLNPINVTNHLPSFTCDTCDQLPAEGLSLSRCSRCKGAWYCSKVCQRAAWKQHKNDCNLSSAMATPDISTPASPTDTTEAMIEIHEI